MRAARYGPTLSSSYTVVVTSNNLAVVVVVIAEMFLNNELRQT